MRCVLVFASLWLLGCVVGTPAHQSQAPASPPPPALEPLVADPMPPRATLRIGSSLGWSEGSAQQVVHSDALHGFVMLGAREVRLLHQESYAQRVLFHSDKYIHKLALSADGRRGVVASFQELLIWSVATGRVERRIRAKRTLALHLSDDGRWLTVYHHENAERDAGRRRFRGVLTRWDLDTGASQELPLQTPFIVLNRPRFSGDGSVVVGMHHRRAAVLTLYTGKLYLPSAPRGVRAVAVDHRGAYVYAISKSHIYVEPIHPRWPHLRKSWAHTIGVGFQLEVSRDGRYLAVHNLKNRRVVLHDAQTRTQKSFPAQHTLAFSSDSKWLFTRVGERAVVRAVPKGTTRNTAPPIDTIRRLVPASDGASLLSASWSGELGAWNTSNGALSRQLKLSRMGQVPVSRHGAYLAAIAPDHIDLVRVATGQPVRRIEVDRSRAAGFSLDEARFAYTDKEGIHVVDLATGEASPAIPYTLNGKYGHYRSSVGEPMTKDQKRHIVVGRGLMLELDATRHRQMIEIMRSRRFAPISVSADGNRVLATHGSGPLFVFDLSSGKRWGVKIGYGAAVAMSPNGRVLAFQNKSAITLWDIEAQRPFDVLRGHRSQVTALAFFADGERLASASRDSTILIWRVRTKR